MGQKIQKWSKLEKKVSANPFDLGGSIAETGAGMLGGALTGLATGNPLAALAGAGTALIGGVVKGIFGSKAEKEQKEAQRVQMMAAKQQGINQLPTSAGGLSQAAVRAYGGYLTSDTLQKANKGLKINKMALGGPPDGDDPIQMSQADYDKEVVKRKQAYDDEYLKQYTSKSFGAGDPFADKTARQEYEKKKPFSISDIAVANPNVTKTANSTVLSEGFDMDGFDYRDKTWHPSSAATSRYNLLKQSGKDKEADELVFGYFDTNKRSSGEYNEKVFSNSVKEGRTKAIRYGDLYKIPQIGNDINKTYLPNMYDMMDQIEKSEKFNSTKKAKGGYINPLSMPNNGLFSFQGGGTHAQNPLGGIPIGKTLQGKQNSVEHGESTFTFPEGKYIFSNRLKLKK